MPPMIGTDVQAAIAKATAKSDRLKTVRTRERLATGIINSSPLNGGLGVMFFAIIFCRNYCSPQIGPGLLGFSKLLHLHLD
jgi:hypothetical protein